MLHSDLSATAVYRREMREKDRADERSRKDTRRSIISIGREVSVADCSD